MLEQLFRSKRMAEVVNGLMRKFASDQDFDDTKESELFEIFSAYCIVGMQYRGDFDPEELRTGGSHDLGVDDQAPVNRSIVDESPVPQNGVGGRITDGNASPAYAGADHPQVAGG